MSVLELKDRHITARKQHTCFWCGTPIYAGDTYNYHVQICDGDFIVRKEHKQCEHIARQMMNGGEPDDRYDVDDFRDYVRRECGDCSLYERLPCYNCVHEMIHG